MLKHDARKYIDYIVQELRISNSFKLLNGVSDAKTFPLLKGGFVSWKFGTGVLYLENGLWKISTKTGLDYPNGDLITPLYPYFQAGHPLELNEILTDLGKTKDKKKYPLFYLQEDVNEGEREDAYTDLLNIKLFVLTLTKKTYRSKDRMTATFEPLLIPLFRLFLEQLDRMGIPYNLSSKTNRKYWGRQSTYKNESNILDDPIDGIDTTITITINEQLFCKI